MLIPQGFGGWDGPLERSRIEARDEANPHTGQSLGTGCPGWARQPHRAEGNSLDAEPWVSSSRPSYQLGTSAFALKEHFLHKPASPQEIEEGDTKLNINRSYHTFPILNESCVSPEIHRVHFLDHCWITENMHLCILNFNRNWQLSS